MTDPERWPLSAAHGRRAAILVIGLVAVLRLLHLAFALRSPLSFQIGPDEDYYLRFAQDVAHGTGGLTSEFTFMDPLYGYLLGFLLWLPGGTPALMYVCQVVVDCGTALGLIVLGRSLGRPGTGILAALIYALLAPAMAFTAALLKTTWVTAYICWWMVLAVRAHLSRTPVRWLLFGAYCGLGVALRANLILLAPLAMLIPWLPAPQARVELGHRRNVMLAVCLIAGLSIPLVALLARNVTVDGRYSPVPTNGGVVLHQMYHKENPQSRSPGLPSFVAYAHPSEIFRGYRDEAERRAGQPLDPAIRDHYWRQEGRRYLLDHFPQSVRNGLRKLAEFTAFTEVPNNRHFADERRFSPVIRWLPQPFGWLFALGVPGLILLFRQDRRSWILAAPLAMGLVTIGVFFAEDRFRFNIVTPFVFGSAVWLAWCYRQASRRRYGSLALGLCLSCILAGWSVWQAARLPEFAPDWQRMATGYFKKGDYRGLMDLLREVEARDPASVGLDEFRGLLALAERDYRAARIYYERALSVRENRHEVWHNYATALASTGDLEHALAAEAIAYQLDSSPEYAFRIGELLERLQRTTEAADVYSSLEASAPPWGAKAKARLSALGH